MYQENETVISKKDISISIPKNTVGVVHSIYENGKFYLVEFVDEYGVTIGDGLETVSSEDIDRYIGNSFDVE